MNLPPGYYECVRKMGKAAEFWLSTNKAELAFHLPPEGVMFLCDLDKSIDLLTRNDAAKKFLLFIEKASGGQGTAFQACVIVRSLGLPVTDWNLGELVARGVQIKEQT